MSTSDHRLGKAFWEAAVPVPQGSPYFTPFGFAKYPNDLNHHFNVERHCPLSISFQPHQDFCVTCQFMKPLVIKGQWSILFRTQQTSTAECRTKVTAGEAWHYMQKPEHHWLLSVAVVAMVVTGFFFFFHQLLLNKLFLYTPSCLFSFSPVLWTLSKANREW